MRDAIVIVLIFIFVISGSMFSSNFYNEMYKDFSEKLDVLAATIEKDVNKEEKVKEIEDLWKEKERLLIVFQDHSLVGDIEENLYECFQYYRYNEKDHFDAMKDKVLMEIEDLIKREAFSIVNIL